MKGRGFRVLVRERMKTSVPVCMCVYYSFEQDLVCESLSKLTCLY